MGNANYIFMGRKTIFGRKIRVRIARGKRWLTKPHPYWWVSNRPSFFSFQSGPFEFFYTKVK